MACLFSFMFRNPLGEQGRGKRLDCILAVPTYCRESKVWNSRGYTEELQNKARRIPNDSEHCWLPPTASSPCLWTFFRRRCFRTHLIWWRKNQKKESSIGSIHGYYKKREERNRKNKGWLKDTHQKNVDTDWIEILTNQISFQEFKDVDD